MSNTQEPISRAALRGALDALEAISACDEDFLRNGLDYRKVGKAIGKAQAALAFFRPEVERMFKYVEAGE